MTCLVCTGLDPDGMCPNIPRAQAVPDDAIRAAANALLHQIDIGDFVDGHGHSAKMLKAVHDLTRALSAAPVDPSEIEHPTSRYLFKQMMKKHGIEPGIPIADALRLLHVAPTVPDEKITARRVAREVFGVCEQFEELADRADADQRTLDFNRGQRFAAKRIRTAIGIWLTDEENAQPAAPAVREPLTYERLQKHARRAGDCPPGSVVVLLSSLRRMLGITGAGNG